MHTHTHGKTCVYKYCSCPRRELGVYIKKCANKNCKYFTYGKKHTYACSYMHACMHASKQTLAAMRVIKGVRFNMEIVTVLLFFLNCSLMRC